MWSLQCYCAVIHTYLMTPDYHSHANASFVISVTRVGEHYGPLSVFILSIIDCRFPSRQY